jgi:hypothetical protein
MGMEKAEMKMLQRSDKNSHCRLSATVGKEVLDQRLVPLGSRHEVHSTRTLYFTCDLAVDPCCYTCGAAAEELSGLGGELGQQFCVLVVDLVHGYVHAAMWHFTIMPTKIRHAFWRLGRAGHEQIIKRLADFAVKRALLHEVVEFHFLQAARRTWAFFVTA